MSSWRSSANQLESSAGEPQLKPQPSLRSYWLPRDQPFTVFLLLSVVLFAASAGLAFLIPPETKLPPMIEVDLGVDGVEIEPPPLGEPDAGLGELKPAPEEIEVTPAPLEPVPAPDPAEPVPEMLEEVAPPIQPEPEFTVPEEKPIPKAAPKAKAQPKSTAKPVQAPRTVETGRVAAAAPNGAPVGSGETTGRTGIRGSPTGTAGGRGGGRGDFTSTPHPQYDPTARQRAYEGRGIFLIVYSGGRIVSVSTQQSTGVPYLDARTISWIKSRWRVKSGVSGSGRLPITWRLK